MLLAFSLILPAFAAETGAPPAPAVIVWLEPEVPGLDAQGRAVRLAGGAARHLAWADLALTPGDWTEEDRTRLLAVQSAVEAGRKRWNDFDVELGIAQQIAIAVDNVTLLRDDDDRKAVAESLVMAGTATLRNWPEGRFPLADDAGPFRTMVSAKAVPLAFVDALALDPDRAWTRQDVDDQAAVDLLASLATELEGLPAAKLTLPALPPGVELILDGRPVAEGTIEVPLLPGRHYLHARMGSTLAGRTELVVAAGQQISYPLRVDLQQLTAARAVARDGSLTLSPEVSGAIQPLSTIKGQAARVYLGTVDEKGRASLMPYAGGAELVRPKPVTFVVTGDLGPGAVLSQGFSGFEEESKAGIAFGGNLGGELGIYNFAVLAGNTLYITPGQRMQFANSDSTENRETPVYLRPYGGFGVYLPRPRAGAPLFLLGATYGALLPGSNGLGGHFAVGIPVSSQGSWVRMSFDLYAGAQEAGFPGEGTTTRAGMFRVGFARKL